MSRLDEPIRFEPYLQARVWGGCRLAPLLGVPATGSEPIGEAWIVSDHPVHRSVVAEGPQRGRTLRDLMESDAEGLVGAGKFAVFPWLVKLLDCHERLSVQVHPDRAAVARLVPGEGSKTEAWFVLEAGPDARVWAGLNPGVDEKSLRSAIAQKKVADCLHTFVPKPGDCVFLPAGTVHAVGGGVVMAEIQETSDVTFRLYDWDRVDAQGRGRQLHLEEAIASIHWDAGPVTPVSVGDVAGGADRDLVRSEEAFILEYRRATAPVELAGGRLQTLIVLAGDATWSSGVRIAAGQSWVLPAAVTKAMLVPSTAGVSFLLARK